MTAHLAALAPMVGAVVAQNVFFYLIAAVMVVAALRVVTTSNMVHAALYLVVVLAGVAAQFILLGAEFVGVTQVLVYIGAVIVLFLFGIMLTRAKVGDEEGLSHDNIAPAALTAILLVIVMAYAVVDFSGTSSSEISGSVVAVPSSVAEVLDLDDPIVANLSVVNFTEATDDDAPALATSLFVRRSPAAKPNGIPVRNAPVLLLDSDGEMVSETVTDVKGVYTFAGLDDGQYSVLYDGDERAVKIGGQREIDVIGNDPTTVEQVSDSIFSTYIVAFEAISVLLLAALIGAIVVARKE